MSFYCKSLSLQTIPYLGVYSRDEYKIMTSVLVKKEIENLPELLNSQISKLDPTILEFMTIKHKGKWLESIENFSEVNLLFQSYIFFDSFHGQKHECTVKAAVYTDDNELSNSHMTNHISDSVAINPSDIFECDLFTCIHPEGDIMCLSPNNGRIRLSTFIPVHVFYSLVLVPFKGEIVKGLVSKHVVVINEQKLDSFMWVEEYCRERYDIEAFTDLMEKLGGHPGWVWYLHRIAWKMCGSPNVHEFGKNQWEHIIQNFLDDEEAKEKLDMLLRSLVEDLQEWVRYIKKNLI